MVVAVIVFVDVDVAASVDDSSGGLCDGCEVNLVDILSEVDDVEGFVVVEVTDLTETGIVVAAVVVVEEEVVGNITGEVLVSATILVSAVSALEASVVVCAIEMATLVVMPPPTPPPIVLTLGQSCCTPVPAKNCPINVTVLADSPLHAMFSALDSCSRLMMQFSEQA